MNITRHILKRDTDCNEVRTTIDRSHDSVAFFLITRTTAAHVYYRRYAIRWDCMVVELRSGAHSLPWEEL